MSKNPTGFLLAAALLLLLSGCCGCNQREWPASPNLSHMDLGQKMAYMENVQQTLAVYRTTFDDIQQHTPPPASDEEPLCGDDQYYCQVAKYVEVYAMPAILDEGARHNLQTRHEAAEINLLSAYACYQIEQYGKARSLLRIFEKQFGKDPSVLNSPINARDVEFATFAEGVRFLKRKLLVG